MKESNSLSSEESLEIITQMIETAKGNIRGSGFYFLFWGWVVIAGNLGHFYLMEFTDVEHPYAVWLITIPAWIISMLYGYRQSATEKVQTYSGKLIMWMWIAFTICLVILIFSGKFGELIPPVILLIAGIPTFMSGLILKFRPLIYGGSSFWIFSVIAFSVEPSYSLLVSAMAIAVGYLIPGYKLRSA